MTTVTDTPTPERAPVAVHEIGRGDWILVDGKNGGRPMEVLGAHPFRLDPMEAEDSSVMLVVRGSQSEIPVTLTFSEGDAIRTATEAEVEAETTRCHRGQLLNELLMVRTLIVDRDLPVTRLAFSVTVDSDELDSIAARLGLPVRETAYNRIASWPEGRMSYEAGVHMSFVADKPQA